MKVPSESIADGERPKASKIFGGTLVGALAAFLVFGLALGASFALEIIAEGDETGWVTLESAIASESPFAVASILVFVLALPIAAFWPPRLARRLAKTPVAGFIVSIVCAIPVGGLLGGIFYMLAFMEVPTPVTDLYWTAAAGLAGALIFGFLGILASRCDPIKQGDLDSPNA